MRNVLVVLLSVVLSSTAYAQTAQPVDIRAPEAPAREVVVERTVTEEEETTEVQEAERVQHEERVSDDAVAERPMPRGSFWWYVGIIVVAAVIIAVVL